MSKFPSRIVDLSIERELFDHTGALPPVARLTVELPSEYVKKPEPGATPPYSDGGIDLNVLSDIQSAVMRKYGGIARQYLNAFRQDVSLGSNVINGRIARLGDGVRMNYVSQFGNESINIRVNEEGVRKLIGGEQYYILVLYGTNKIAALAVDGGGNFSKHLDKKLTMSSWSAPATWASYFSQNVPPFFLVTAQLRLGDKFHAMTCPLYISSSGVISIPPTLEQRPMYNVKDTLLKYAESTTFGNTYATPGIPPIINGGSTYVWTENHEKFSISSGVIKREIDGVGVTPLWTVDDVPNPIYVSTTGDRYSPIQTDSVFGTSGHYYIFPYTEPQISWKNAFPNFSAGLGSNPAWVYCFGPEDSGQVSEVDFGGQMTITTKMGYINKSLSGYVLKSTDITCSMTCEYHTNFFDLHGSYNGITEPYLTNTGFGHATMTYLIHFGFPYAINPTKNGMFYMLLDRTVPISYPKTVVVTPYERVDIGAYPYTIELGETYQKYIFRGWLDLSDNKHHVQGYLINGKKRIYMDGKEVGTKIAKILNCKIDDIVTMFLGVKLDDISKLK